MPKISRYKLEKEIEGLILDQFAEVLREVNKTSDIKALIGNLFTPSERIMLAKRLAIAILLENGWDYSKIVKKLKVSPTTISFVKNSKLNLSPAYEKLLQNLEKIFFVNLKEDDFVSRINKKLNTFPRKTGGGRWRFLNN